MKIAILKRLSKFLHHLPPVWRVLLFLTLNCPHIYSQTVWKCVNPMPPTSSLNAIAFGNNRFVAVGGWGTIICADSTMNWKRVECPDSLHLKDISFNKHFIALAGNKNIIMTSPDGLHWKQYETDSLNFISIAYTDSVYYATTRDMSLYSSNDLKNWTKDTLFYGGQQLQYCQGLLFGPRLIIWKDTPEPFFSTSRRRWPSSTIPNSNISYGYNVPNKKVAYGNGVYVATSCLKEINISTDGYTWNKYYRPANEFMSDCIESVTFGNGRFMIIDSDGVIFTSEKGTDWKLLSNISAHNTFTDMAFGNNVSVVITYDGAIYSSHDCVSWNLNTKGILTYLESATSDGKQFVISGGGSFKNASGVILLSKNGIVWDTVLADQHGPIFSQFLNNKYISFTGSDSNNQNVNVFSSFDGKKWKCSAQKLENSIQSCAYGNKAYVAVGKDCILHSKDGQQWLKIEDTVKGLINSVAFGNGLFVAAGYNYKLLQCIIFTSTDGLKWKQQDLPIFYHLESVAYGSDKFVIVGKNIDNKGIILSSPDGLTWDIKVRDSIPGLNDVAYCHDLFVTVGVKGSMYTSRDAINWSKKISSTGRDLFSICYGNGKYIVSGCAGTILYSDDEQIQYLNCKDSLSNHDTILVKEKKSVKPY